MSRLLHSISRRFILTGLLIPRSIRVGLETLWRSCCSTGLKKGFRDITSSERNFTVRSIEVPDFVRLSSFWEKIVFRREEDCFFPADEVGIFRPQSRRVCFCDIVLHFFEKVFKREEEVPRPRRRSEMRLVCSLTADVSGTDEFSRRMIAALFRMPDGCFDQFEGGVRHGTYIVVKGADSGTAVL